MSWSAVLRNILSLLIVSTKTDIIQGPWKHIGSKLSTLIKKLQNKLLGMWFNKTWHKMRVLAFINLINSNIHTTDIIFTVSISGVFWSEECDSLFTLNT